MSRLAWDAIGAKNYETGVDHGVLYLPTSYDSIGLPWSGLTSVTRSPTISLNPTYYDGAKIGDEVVVGEFSGSVSAFSYPQILDTFTGLSQIVAGVSVDGQNPQRLGLAYRSRVGTDLDPSAGYKIHIMWNLYFVPSERSYQSMTNDPSLMEFSWDVSAVPEIVTDPAAPHIRPAAYAEVDSRTVASEFLDLLESTLFGTESTDAYLPSFSDFVTFAANFIAFRVADLGGGTWGAFDLDSDDTVYITDVNETTGVATFDTPTVTWVDEGAGIYTISDIA